MSADEDTDNDLSGDSEFDDDELDDDDDFDDDDEDTGSSKKKLLIVVAATLLIIGVIIYMFASSVKETAMEEEVGRGAGSAATETSGASPEDSPLMPAASAVSAQKDNTPETEEQQTTASLEQERMNREIAEQESASTEEKTEPVEETEMPVDIPLPVKEEVKEKKSTEPADRAETSDNFTIQVGTYVLKESVNRARGILRKMKMKGEESTSRVLISRYEVLVGDFQDVEEMRNIVKILSNEGISVNVKVPEPGKYTLSVLSGFSRARAYEKKKDLTLKGYPATVKEERKKRTVYVLRTGHYSAREQAKEDIGKLKSKGLGAMLLRIKG